MSEHRLRLGWDDLTLRIASTHTELWERLDGVLDPIRLRTFEVGVDRCAADRVDLRFEERDAAPTVERTPQGVLVAGPLDYWGRGERLACSVLQVVDHRRLRSGRVCFHGVTLARGDRAVLLTGPSESGKTSAGVEVLRRATGATSLLSNDHVLGTVTSGAGVVVEPNPHVSVALRSHAVWLNDRAAYAALLGRHDTPVRHHRFRVPATELGAVEPPPGAVALHAVVFVGAGTAASFLGYPTPDLRARTAINADLAGRVRAGTLFPLDDSGDIGPCLPDLTDDLVEATIDATVEEIVGNGRAFDARGPVQGIAEFVDDLLGAA